MRKLSLIIAVLFISTGCVKTSGIQRFHANNENLRYQGRVDKLENETILISSASSVSTKVKGKICNVYLKNNSGSPNYVSIEVDGEIVERINVSQDSITAYPIILDPNKNEQIVSVYKATEAGSSNLSFYGFDAEKIEKTENTNSFKIEFIGDSITCAAGSENEEIQCEEGSYFDHSDGYNSYASVIGRELKADVVLSSVSGIGIYRNWNSVKGEAPIMPEVYENLYLNYNDKPYNFKGFQPDIISICLGTNDFSKGNGVKPRLPFNSEKYTLEYIKFIETVIKNNPNAKIILLDSPMVRDENKATFNECLTNIQVHFAKEIPQQSITTFSFDDSIYPTGCGFHPAVKEHKEMAKQLAPVLKKLI